MVLLRWSDMGCGFMGNDRERYAPHNSPMIITDENNNIYE